METNHGVLALAHKGSKTPWVIYDIFVQGISVDEILAQLYAKGASFEDVNAPSARADIEQMRSWERARYPEALLTDADCDQLRNLHLLAHAARTKIDASGSDMKAANDLGLRRDVILHQAHQRYEE